MCDGSHKGSGLGPQKFTLEHAQKVWLCNCKHTKKPPFCDGSHRDLEPEKPATEAEAEKNA